MSPNISKPSATLVPLFSKIISSQQLLPSTQLSSFLQPHIFTPSSFGIAKVLPFLIPTKCFNNFFLSPHFNTLIPTKKNIAIYYHDTLENRCFLRLFRNSGKTFSVFDRADFHVGLPQFLSASSQNFLYFVSHCYVLRFTNIHKAFSAKQMPTLRCLKTVTKPQ